MRDLTHGRGTVGVHALGEFPKVGHDGIIACVEIAISCGRISRDQSATAEHRQSDASFGLFFVVESQGILLLPTGTAGYSDRPL